MKLFFSLCLALCLASQSSAGIYESLNPTKLWEFRDSLQTLSKDSAYADESASMLARIPQFNAYLSRVREIIPFPRLRIDIVAVSNCPGNATDIAAIQKRLEKERFTRIATDCTRMPAIVQYANERADCEIVNAGEPELNAFIRLLGENSHPRIQHIVRLAKMVQCEYAMVTLGLSLKQYRLQYGDPNREIAGLLIVDGYYVDEHLHTILRLVKAQSNIDY